MKDKKKEINEMILNNYQSWYAELGKFPVSGHPLLRMRVGDTHFILFYFTYGDKESKNCKTRLESELAMKKRNGNWVDIQSRPSRYSREYRCKACY